MKTKPTRFAGWVGRISLSSYPHAGVRRQQQIALAAKGLDMQFRIGAPDAGVKRHKPRGTGDHSSFLASQRGPFSSFPLQPK
jgi:hypothetical protein